MAGGIQARFGYPVLTQQQVRRGQVGSLAVTVVGLLTTLGAAIAWGVNRGQHWAPKAALGAGLALAVGGGVGLRIWHRRLDGPSICRRELALEQGAVLVICREERNLEDIRTAARRLVRLYRDVYQDEAAARIALLVDAGQLPTTHFDFAHSVMQFFAMPRVDGYRHDDLLMHWLTPVFDDQGRCRSQFAMAAGAWIEMMLEHGAYSGSHPGGAPRGDAVEREVDVLSRVLASQQVHQLPDGSLRGVIQCAAARFVMVEAVVTQAIGLERAAELIVGWTAGHTPELIHRNWLEARGRRLRTNVPLQGGRQRCEALEAACTARRGEFLGTSAWPDGGDAGRPDPWEV